jgi:hypothetical protein
MEMEDISTACRRRAQEASSYRTTLLDAADEIERLRRVLAEQEEDARRLDWAEAHALAIDAVADPDNFVQVWHGTHPAKCARGRSIREAIDAAIEAGKGEK